MPKHTLKEPLKAFLISSPNPELKGLEIAFDCEGFVGMRCVEDRSLGFILTKETSLILAELILKEQQSEAQAQTEYSLAE
jgi:hypothetical protein